MVDKKSDLSLGLFSPSVPHRKEKQTKNEEDIGHREWETQLRKGRQFPRMTVKGDQRDGCCTRNMNRSRHDSGTLLWKVKLVEYLSLLKGGVDD